MRDAQVCAKLDSRTNQLDFERERSRTGKLLNMMIRAGRADEVQAVKVSWEEADAMSDKACPFQLESASEPSIETYRSANDALEAVILAEIA